MTEGVETDLKKFYGTFFVDVWLYGNSPPSTSDRSVSALYTKKRLRCFAHSFSVPAFSGYGNIFILGGVALSDLGTPAQVSSGKARPLAIPSARRGMGLSVWSTGSPPPQHETGTAPAQRFTPVSHRRPHFKIRRFGDRWCNLHSGSELRYQLRIFIGAKPAFYTSLLKHPGQIPSHLPIALHAACTISSDLFRCPPRFWRLTCEHRSHII